MGLSFKAATDDLRESPQVQLVKHLLGEGCAIKIWDDNVSLGRLLGSNREYIEQAIPHIGSLLENDLKQILKDAQVVVIGTRGISRDQLQAFNPISMVKLLVKRTNVMMATLVMLWNGRGQSGELLRKNP